VEITRNFILALGLLKQPRGRKEKIMEHTSPVTVMALLTEMARCLNKNMGKIKIAPIDPAVIGNLPISASLPDQPGQ
jgi:hypothetical protein